MHLVAWRRSGITEMHVAIPEKIDGVLNWANGLKSIRDREEKANRESSCLLLHS